MKHGRLGGMARAPAASKTNLKGWPYGSLLRGHAGRFGACPGVYRVSSASVLKEHRFTRLSKEKPGTGDGYPSRTAASLSTHICSTGPADPEYPEWFAHTSLNGYRVGGPRSCKKKNANVTRSVSLIPGTKQLQSYQMSDWGQRGFPSCTRTNGAHVLNARCAPR